MSHPDDIPEDYDPRYLAGILFFNGEEYFEAHEVWEEIWQECAGPERRYIQGLIQAAVALHHFGNGNLRGAAKLYRTSREYMSRFGTSYLGLDIEDFWRQMEACFVDVNTPPAEGTATLDMTKLPRITITPEPPTWPNPRDFVEHEES